jgi:aminoglycoside phosphotransferase (APT) family kinase protein
VSGHFHTGAKSCCAVGIARVSIGGMVVSSGVRIAWLDVPGEVRSAVEVLLGAPVVEATSQVGGFSPGTADRVRTADGRRAFVKAVSPAQNPDSPGMHRREARITAALPAHAPAPGLLGVHDDGDWVALVLEDVEGRHPVTPWRPDEVARVLATLTSMAHTLTPTPIDHVPTVADSLAGDFEGWRNIAADPPSDLDDWAAERVDELEAWTDRGLAALTGDTLVHLDVRADNLLLGADGRVTVVDWPWACTGPAWLDRLLLLVNVRLYGGDTDDMFRRCVDESGADRDDLVSVLVGLAGFFLDNARRPPPPGIPTVRAFQRAQGDVVLAWLRALWAS